MTWLLRRHTIHHGLPFIAAAALVSPPLVTLELLCMIAVVSGEPLAWFKPESQEFLRFAAMTYLAASFVLAIITALLLLWRRHPSMLEALFLAVLLPGIGLLFAEPARLADGPPAIALQTGVISLIVLPAVLCAGWVAALWGAFRPRKADPAPN